MMEYSAHAPHHHQGLRVFAVEIATVVLGSGPLFSEWCLSFGHCLSPRMLLSSCSSCKCESSCLNKPFQHRPVKKMKLVKTEKCGSGIVADEDIKQGEFVIEYVGEDQDCHCGAVGCREKLGVRPTKPKMSSVAALKLVACQLAVSSPKVKGMFSAKDVYPNGGFPVGSSQPIRKDHSQGGTACNCIDEVIRIRRPINERSFGVIKRFDNHSQKHAIMFEDGGIEILDMSKEEWEFVTL
ncbi:hypothetical protein ACLB2K_007206 [Fragaria x ananassa]